jgi:hypothetical protein
MMKRLLIVALLATLFGGCVVTPAYQRDYYSRGPYYSDRYHDRYYYRGGGYYGGGYYSYGGSGIYN